MDFCQLVIKRLVFFSFVLFSPSLFALAAIKIDVDIHSQFYEQSPIEGTLLISHGSKDTIDTSSFTINSKPLQVELKQEQPMTAPGDLVLSMYRFSLPPQPKGLHILPAIKVVVGGKTYQSIPRTYEVKGTAVSPSTPPAPEAKRSAQPTPPATQPLQQTQEGPFLKLEAFVNGSQELYPGQQTTVGYRFFYNTNLNTSKESFPLLDAEGFTKVGDKTIKEEESEGVSVQQIEQIIEATQPGEYPFGPSFLEAIPYQLDSAGRHIPSGEKLSSVVPMVVLKVKPFPDEGKPASFNGGVGNFNWKIQLKSPSTVNSGDEIELLVEASGQGNLNGLNLPELCCQPGISGLFRMSDLPPVGTVKGDVKRFQVKLRPLSTSVKEIPSLEFSSFDPETREYKRVHTKPIPITVVSLQSNTLPTSSNTTLQTPNASQTNPTPSSPSPQTTAPIEIESLYPLTAHDLEDLPFGTWYSLFLIPLGMGALIFQWNLFQQLSKFKQTPKTIKSQELLDKAIRAPLESAERHVLISQALLLALKEKGYISSEKIDIEQLPSTDLTGEVRTFLLEIEKDRYSGNDRLKEEEIQKRAQALFETIHTSGDQK